MFFRKFMFFLVIFSFFYKVFYGKYGKIDGCFKIAQLQYGGGGDWYANPSSLLNLIDFINKKTPLCIERKRFYVRIDEGIFEYPIVYMTGHGRVFFNEDEVFILRKYLISGGFLFADDNFGMDRYFRREIKKVFPNKDLIKLSPSFPIFRSFFRLRYIPKIHKHYGGPPVAYGIFYKNRMVVFYSFNTDLGDGWEDPEVHGDPEYKRLLALKMGANVVYYVVTH